MDNTETRDTHDDAQVRSARTILFIEDDLYISDMLAKYFRDQQYIAECLYDGEAAMRRVGNREEMTGVDIVLLDILLPNINGFEILKKLKMDPATKTIPVIVVSNLGDQEHIDEARRLGAVDYIIKANALPRDIVTKVEEVLAGGGKWAAASEPSREQ
ncbi:MAG: response regulator [bacterium]|nr:response regulator [bacterium]MDZ4284687.1 response regulator [Patescibacteria group bacterium]